jgi:hypothetical protein
MSSYITPSACGVCERGHDQAGSNDTGHPYTVPTEPQMKARLMMKQAAKHRRPVSPDAVKAWCAVLAEDPGPGANPRFGELCEFYAAGHVARGPE